MQNEMHQLCSKISYPYMFCIEMQKVAAKNTAMSPGALMKIDGAARCNAAVLMRCVQIVI